MERMKDWLVKAAKKHLTTQLLWLIAAPLAMVISLKKLVSMTHANQKTVTTALN